MSFPSKKDSTSPKALLASSRLPPSSRAPPSTSTLAAGVPLPASVYPGAIAPIEEEDDESSAPIRSSRQPPFSSRNPAAVAPVSLMVDMKSKRAPTQASLRQAQSTAPAPMSLMLDAEKPQVPTASSSRAPPSSSIYRPSASRVPPSLRAPPTQSFATSSRQPPQSSRAPPTKTVTPGTLLQGNTLTSLHVDNLASLRLDKLASLNINDDDDDKDDNKSNEIPNIASLRQNPKLSSTAAHSLALSSNMIRSMAPPSVKSILITPEDHEKALKQTMYETLPAEEKKEQEAWVQTMVRRSGVCPEGYTWARREGGYQCDGGGHGVTDELIAEGKGGIISMKEFIWGKYDGPFYPSSVKRPGEPNKVLWEPAKVGFVSAYKIEG